MVPLMENAVASMVTGVDQMVWVMDYNGFGAGSCNPMTRKAAATILADLLGVRRRRGARKRMGPGKSREISYAGDGECVDWRHQPGPARFAKVPFNSPMRGIS